MSSGVYIGKVTEPFLAADRLAEQERMAQRAKIKTRKPRIIPMPRIDINPNIEGPLHVTQEFKDEFHKQKAEEKKKEKHEYERELLQCLGKKERLQHKLTTLNPAKKKDSKKIVSIRFKIRELDEKIKRLEKESGIKLDELKGDSKLGKIWNRVKSVVVKVYKKVKKFFKKNRDAIEGVLMVALPIIGANLIKNIFWL